MRIAIYLFSQYSRACRRRIFNFVFKWIWKHLAVWWKEIKLAESWISHRVNFIPPSMIMITNNNIDNWIISQMHEAMAINGDRCLFVAELKTASIQFVTQLTNKKCKAQNYILIKMQKRPQRSRGRAFACYHFHHLNAARVRFNAIACTKT